MSKRHPEADIHRQIVKYIRIQYPSVLTSCSPVELIRGKLGGAIAVGMGYMKGWPDLMIYHPSGDWCGLALEIKTKTGAVSKEQRSMHDSLRARGWTVMVVRSFDEGRGAVDEFMGKLS